MHATQCVTENFNAFAYFSKHQLPLAIQLSCTLKLKLYKFNYFVPVSKKYNLLNQSHDILVNRFWILSFFSTVPCKVPSPNNIKKKKKNLEMLK